MSAKKQLKEKYEKFCLEFRKNGGNATKAAIAAGYSAKTAKQQGSRLLTNVDIQQRIFEMAKDAGRKGIISVERRQEILSVVAANEDEDVNARIRAIDILNKMDGLYIYKAEVNVVGNFAAKLKARKEKHG